MRWVNKALVLVAGAILVVLLACNIEPPQPAHFQWDSLPDHTHGEVQHVQATSQPHTPITPGDMDTKPGRVASVSPPAAQWPEQAQTATPSVQDAAHGETLPVDDEGAGNAVPPPAPPPPPAPSPPQLRGAGGGNDDAQEQQQPDTGRQVGGATDAGPAGDDDDDDDDRSGAGDSQARGVSVVRYEPAVPDWSAMDPIDALHARVYERYRSAEYPFDTVPAGGLTERHFETWMDGGEIVEILPKLTSPAKLSFNFVLRHTDDDGVQTPLHVYWKHGDYRAGESAWNEALAFAVDRTFGFGLIPPTRMVRLDLDDMKEQLTTVFQERGASNSDLDAQLALIENWRKNAKDNLKSRWKRTGKYDMIGVHVLFYGWPFHDSSGPRDIQWDRDSETVEDYNGDAEEAKAYAEFNMLIWLCNCPRSAHGFFYDRPHKRWVMLDNDRCLGKREQPFPKFLFRCEFPRDLVDRLRETLRAKSACKQVKAYMREHDPLAASEVIPRFKRKAGEHKSIELPNGKCALNQRIKQLLDHVDWCHKHRGGDNIYFDRTAFGGVDDVRLATPKQLANARTSPKGKGYRTIKQKKQPKRRRRK